MATLQDIAKQAGVSIPTVSRILNPKNGPRVASAKTELLVRQIARKLNYFPNASARALSTQRTQNIGLMWDKRMDSPEETIFWSPVLRGLMAGCKRAGYDCMVSVEDYHTPKGFELPRGFRERSVDGVVVTYPLGDAAKQVQNKLIESGIPFVVIWASFVDPSVWSVDVDSNPGIRQALLHLYEFGHRKIGYCVYPHWHLGEYHASEQLEKQVRQEFGINLTPLVVDLTRNTHQEEGQNLADKLASGELDITAMIMGDLISIEAIKRLSEKNIRVPDDFSVIGLAGTKVCEYCTPTLSTLVSPLVEVGEKAASLLVDDIKAGLLGVKLEPRHVTLSQGFIARESTGPVPAGGKKTRS
ncbi:MAG: LacI family DNA-binding transcriptional regulator [Phycisphaerae bacterium]|nr:LacI family DNA-binding transcriptional regulator [Phycisphaerae bacterium]